MVRAIVAGACGKMGKRIINMIHETEGIELAGAFEHPESPYVGKDAAEQAGLPPAGVIIEDSITKALNAGEVVIDFTFHDSAVPHAEEVKKAGKSIVIGTTGLDASQIEALKKIALNTPVVQAPNMSVGINLLYKLVQTAARSLGDDYDIEIVEAHHRLKKDAPSGTALQLGRVAAEATGRSLEKDGVFERNGIIGERSRNEIGIQTVRAGDIVGEHTVMFGGIGERIEITHKASSRDTFAKGAVRAAIWLHNREPGFYNMLDVLGLN